MPFLPQGLCPSCQEVKSLGRCVCGSSGSREKRSQPGKRRGKKLSRQDRGYGVLHTRARRELVCSRVGTLCDWGCGRVGTEADHVVPLVLGGESVRENLVWSCKSRNAARGAILRHRMRVLRNEGIGGDGDVSVWVFSGEKEREGR